MATAGMSHGSAPPITPKLDPFGNNSKESQRLFVVDLDCYDLAFSVKFPWNELLWEMTDKALTSIWALNAPYRIYNVDEEDPLRNKKMK